MTLRPAARVGAVWLFGLATTIFMIALWGRAVVIDTDALGEAAAPLSDSGAVVDLVTGWLEEEMVEAGVDPVTADLVAEDLMERSEVGAALERLVGELIEAAAVPGPDGGVIDIASILEPAIPEIEWAMSAAGVAVSEDQVAEVVSGLDPLVVRGPGSEPYIGRSSPTAGRLGTAAALSLAIMLVTGWVAVAASNDPMGELRSLLNRVALGGLSFAILLRAGSWVLDPRGGRAPLSETASVIAGSKGLVPLSVAVAAAAAGAAVWAWRRRIRRGAVSRSPDEPPTQPEEQRLIRSGRH